MTDVEVIGILKGEIPLDRPTAQVLLESYEGRKAQARENAR